MNTLDSKHICERIHNAMTKGQDSLAVKILQDKLQLSYNEGDKESKITKNKNDSLKIMFDIEKFFVEINDVRVTQNIEIDKVDGEPFFYFQAENGQYYFSHGKGNSLEARQEFNKKLEKLTKEKIWTY